MSNFFRILCFSVLLINAIFTSSCQPDNPVTPNPNPTTCGRVARVRQGSAVTQEFYYDAQGKVQSCILRNPDGTFLRSYRLTRDAAGNITTNVDSSASSKDVTTVQYDANNLATSGVLTRYTGSTSTVANIVYRYTNNRLTTILRNPVSAFAAKDSIVYQYNTAGKVTRAQGFSIVSGFSFALSDLSYTYDADNNVNLITSSSGTFAYTYDTSKPADLPFLYNNGRSLLFYSSLANDDMVNSKRITQFVQGTTTYSLTYTNGSDGCLSTITTAGGGSSIAQTIER